MVKILREADQSPVAEVAKKHGIRDVTIYAWRKRFDVAGEDVVGGVLGADLTASEVERGDDGGDSLSASPAGYLHG